MSQSVSQSVDVEQKDIEGTGEAPAEKRSEEGYKEHGGDTKVQENESVETGPDVETDSKGEDEEMEDIGNINVETGDLESEKGEKI